MHASMGLYLWDGALVTSILYHGICRPEHACMHQQRLYCTTGAVEPCARPLCWRCPVCMRHMWLATLEERS